MVGNGGRGMGGCGPNHRGGHPNYSQGCARLKEFSEGGGAVGGH